MAGIPTPRRGDSVLFYRQQSDVDNNTPRAAVIVQVFGDSFEFCTIRETWDISSEDFSFGPSLPGSLAVPIDPTPVSLSLTPAAYTAVPVSAVQTLGSDAAALESATATATAAARLQNTPRVFSARPGGTWTYGGQNFIETRFTGRVWEEDVSVDAFPNQVYAKGRLSAAAIGGSISVTFSFQPRRPASGAIGPQDSSFLTVSGSIVFNQPGRDADAFLPVSLPVGALTGVGILRFSFASGAVLGTVGDPHRFSDFRVVY